MSTVARCDVRGSRGGDILCYMESESADATPELDTVMAENAELRVVLSHYVDGDLDDHLNEHIRITRAGDVRYEPPVAEESEDATETEAEPEAETEEEPEVKPARRSFTAARNTRMIPAASGTGGKLDPESPNYDYEADLNQWLEAAQ